MTEIKPENIRGILVTVGGSVDPVIKSIKEIHPEFVVLVPSQGTLEKACEVKKTFSDNGMEFNIITTDREDDLCCSHKAVEKGLCYLNDEKNIPFSNILVEFTGGTKVMSAAAVLAGTPKEVAFSYVGGDARNKGGVGTVIPGSEVQRLMMNPWKELKTKQIGLLLEFCKNGQWQAALSIAGQLEDSTVETKKRYTVLKEVLEGLHAWEAFNIKTVLKKLGYGNKDPKSNLSDLPKHFGDIPALKDFAEKCRNALNKNLEVLKGMDDLESLKEKQRHSRLSPSQEEKRKTEEDRLNRSVEKCNDPIVLYVLALAQLKMQRGEYDESVLRTYRSLELFAQRSLKYCRNKDKKCYDIENGKVREEQLPSSLKDKWCPPYKNWKTDSSGTKYLEIALAHSWELLAALGHAKAKEVTKEEGWHEKLMVGTRNKNWLIHGSGNASEKEAKAFLEKTCKLLGIKENALKSWSLPTF